LHVVHDFVKHPVNFHDKVSSEGAPIRAAAIDIGSNAIRLRVAEGNGPSRRTIVEQRHSVRLGMSTYSAGQLDPTSMVAAVDVLKMYGQIARDHHALRYRAVATAAVRDAPNRHQLIDAARRQLGIEIDIIPGEEESRLLFLGIPWNQFPEQLALFEQGSGSLQLAAGTRGEPHFLCALPLGALRLTLSHQAQDILTEPGIQGLRTALREHLDAVFERLNRAGSHSLLGAGSGLCALARMAGTGLLPTLTLVDARSLALRLSAMTVTQKTSLGLLPEKAESISAAAWLAVELMEGMNQDCIHTVDANLRDGILTELLGDPTSGRSLP
jgi:exopolyphosphatase/guanosine-5'-triphosphate,3'-diphosphate pyrophosphatase